MAEREIDTGPRKRVKLSPWQANEPFSQLVCSVGPGNSSIWCEPPNENTSIGTNQPWGPSISSYRPAIAVNECQVSTQYSPASYQPYSVTRNRTPQPHHRQASYQAADSLLGLKDSTYSDQTKLLASSIEDDDYMFLDSGTGGSPSSQVSAHNHRHMLHPHENECIHYIPPVMSQPPFCHPRSDNSASHIHNRDCYLPQYQPCPLEQEQCSFDQCFLEPCCFDQDCPLPSECLQHDYDDCCPFLDCASAASFDLPAITTTLCSSPEADSCHVQEFAYLCNDDNCRIPDRCTGADLCESIPIFDPLAEKKRTSKAVRRKEGIGIVQIDLTEPPVVKMESCHDDSEPHCSHAVPSFSAEHQLKSLSETRIGPKVCLWQTADGQELTCGFTCTTADELQEHIITAHMQSLDGRSSLVCRWQGCPSAASAKPKNTKTKLIRHMVTHSGCKSLTLPPTAISVAKSTHYSMRLYFSLRSTPAPFFF